MLAAKVFFALAFFAVTLVVAESLSQGGEGRRAGYVGNVADVLSLLMYAAPLSVVADVIRTKSVEFMPLGLSLGTLLTTSMWTAYALWVGDLNIGLPNHVGTVLGFAQVGVYSSFVRGSSAKFVPRNVDIPVLGEDMGDGWQRLR